MKEIKLSKGLIAIVDDDNYLELNKHKWCAGKAGKNIYAVRARKINGEYVRYAMHREIMKTNTGYKVDHIDHNGLNNQKSNLRNCTKQQNRKNQKSRSKSGYRGVYYNGKYIIAQFPINGKMKYLGVFKSEIDAAKAYDDMAKIHYREYACLNFK